MCYNLLLVCCAQWAIIAALTRSTVVVCSVLRVRTLLCSHHLLPLASVLIMGETGVVLHTSIQHSASSVANWCRISPIIKPILA